MPEQMVRDRFDNVYSLDFENRPLKACSIHRAILFLYPSSTSAANIDLGTGGLHSLTPTKVQCCPVSGCGSDELALV